MGHIKQATEPKVHDVIPPGDGDATVAGLTSSVDAEPGASLWDTL